MPRPPFTSTDPSAPSVFVEAQTAAPVKPAIVGSEHRFWDKPKLRAIVRRRSFERSRFRRDARQPAEWRTGTESRGHGYVRCTHAPGLAMNFIGETVGVVSLSYLLHKTGHHKLERAVSLVNIGGSASAR